MAQILTRFKMNWLGDWVTGNEWRRTFARVVALVCIYWVLTINLAPPDAVLYKDAETGELDIKPGKPAPPLQLLLFHTVSLSFGLYTLVVLTKLRRMIRRRYEIPPTYLGSGDVEDCCISFWCGCCSVAQMARQTCDYEHQSAACCSPTGLGVSLGISYAHESVLTV
jgi:Cys-rich protein (TIGR01571 family)